MTELLWSSIQYHAGDTCTVMGNSPVWCWCARFSSHEELRTLSPDKGFYGATPVQVFHWPVIVSSDTRLDILTVLRVRF